MEQKRTQQRTVEQVVDIPVPQVVEELVHVPVTQTQARAGLSARSELLGGARSPSPTRGAACGNPGSHDAGGGGPRAKGLEHGNGEA